MENLKWNESTNTQSINNEIKKIDETINFEILLFYYFIGSGKKNLRLRFEEAVNDIYDRFGHVSN